jgi:hypothetical protein
MIEKLFGPLLFGSNRSSYTSDFYLVIPSIDVDEQIFNQINKGNYR